MKQNIKSLIKKSLVSVFVSILIILLLIGIISSGFAAYYTGKLDLINSMGTLLLALATIYIVYEMKKAREQNIEPTLFILDPVYERYEFRWIPLEDLNPIVQPELKPDEKNRYDSRLPVFRLKNIGSGPAKDIELTWYIETDFTHLLNDSIIKKYSPQIEDDFFSLHINEKSITQKYSNLDQFHVDYCIASPSSDFIETITVPLKVFNTYALSLLSTPRSDKISIFSGTNINLLITYLDLHNRRYEKELIITSHFTFLPNGVNAESNLVSPEFFHEDNLRGLITFHVKEK